jgi:predicted hotdog family 3-hydroxylacyl-ACP dehydratase
MLIGKTEIAKMIPHAGAMCLLDGVLSWDPGKIRCIAHSHTDPRNPLRGQTGLHAVCGVEYASQAMAVHGALCGAVKGKPRAGYLAGLRDLVCRARCIDTAREELIVDAEYLIGDQHRVIYRFDVSVGAHSALSGRATVVLDAGESQP